MGEGGMHAGKAAAILLLQGPKREGGKEAGEILSGGRCISLFA